VKSCWPSGSRCRARPAALAAIDVGALFNQAEAAERVGIARKTKLVDGRPARPGEIIVTIIKREGKETQSSLAEAGGVVIRNRCPETGNLRGGSHSPPPGARRCSPAWPRPAP
jgi:hypothetical protein